MSRYVDPFFANRPVDDPKKFSGRRQQIDEIVNSLYQVRHSNPKHTIITGDRGIGKSSLLLQARVLAQGTNSLAEKWEIDLGVDKYDFIASWHDADDTQKPVDIVIGLLRDLDNVFQRFLAKYKLNLNIADIVQISEKHDGDIPLHQLVEDFVKRLEEISEEAKKNSKDGVLLFVDELDRIDPSFRIASFFKLVTENLNRRDVKNIAFFCAGITGAVQNLEEDHASITRVFRDIPIPRLEKKDTRSILVSGFNSVNRDFDPKIIAATHKLAAGYPEPVHLLGSSMLSVDEDNYIDNQDFQKAKDRLIKDVRRNKLSSLLKNAGHGRYQLILEAMANFEGSSDVPNEYISQHLNLEPYQYSSNLTVLKERNIITRPYRGYYSFVDPLLREYIRTFGILQPEESEKWENEE